jgi:hypothetical protein
MNTFRHGSAVAVVLGVLGILGGGCLTRPVSTEQPSINTNFTAVVHNQTVDKVDLLFMIDNSASMGDKQALLAQAVPDMITRLVQPNCLDTTGNIVGQSDAQGNGTCTTGKVEFPPVHNMHIGVVTSSLGGRGGDQCPTAGTNPANPALSAHNDDRGELIGRGGVAMMPTVENTPAPGLNSDNFLTWFPNSTANMNVTPPAGAISVSTTLVTDFATVVEGVHEHGCGFEAQNEAWYRFLVQPDPFDQIVKNGTRAQFMGIDSTILQQRSDFLRPDSLLAIIVVTDENEEAADPLSIGGQGWAFDNASFPGSPNGSSPEGTIECSQQNASSPLMTGPNDPNCTSCAFIQGDPNFGTRCPNNGASGTGGYLDPTNDMLNVRFFNQKIRFGLFAGYPITRYIRGMQETTVPDSAHEHDGSGNYNGDQDSNANCVNPIYAQSLPTSSSSELCALTRGPRTPDLVYYAAIAGVPHQLLQATPGGADGICASGTAAADCPQKDTLSNADWVTIMGNDPENYDFSGADFHMVESEDPRTSQGTNGSSTMWANTSNCPPSSADNCDPINGREWTSNKGDLQFSCIFDITPQYGGTGKDCSQAEYTNACDCATGALNSGTQLCQKGAGGAYTQIQINGKAYPSVREMAIAKAMSNSTAGDQGIVSSLCPIHVSDNSAGNDPLYGYRPAVNAIVNRLKNSLSNQCLPQKLQPDQSQAVPCLILVQLSNSVGPGACANPPTDATGCLASSGLLGPGVTPNGATNPTVTQDILNKFCASQEAAYRAGGGMAGGPNDPDLFPTCALAQLNPVANASDFTAGSCAASMDPGWCYVVGAAAGGCPQAILFTNGEPPHGATVSLQCIEQSVTVLDGGSD